MNAIRCGCCLDETVEELTAFREYKRLVCSQCGFEHFVLIDQAVDSSLYESDADYIDDLGVSKRSKSFILWHHKKALRYLKKHFPPNNTLTLDIGCFNGFFVKELLALGYDSYGIDFNTLAVDQGNKSYSLKGRISTSTLDQLLEQGAEFNVITLFEVLEHLENPKELVAQAVRLLSEDGVLIISTPNKNMCWRPPLDHPPHHLSRFTSKSLMSFVQQFNMTPTYVSEQMSIYELLRHFSGTFFRSKDRGSMRGGEFKYKQLSIAVRRILNSSRALANFLLTPLDVLLHALGIRYISQVVISKKQ